MDKKIIFLIVGGAFTLILLVVFVLFSAGNKQKSVSTFPKGTVTLTIWDPFLDTVNLEPLFEDYQKLHPNVHIVFTKKDQTTYGSDIVNALAAGAGPDIFSINNSQLPEYMNKVASASPAEWGFVDYKDAFVDAAVNDFTQNQIVYGVPLSVDSLGLYYNKDLLGTAGIATPPKTWDELSADVQRLTRQDTTGYFTESGVAIGTNANVNRAVDILYLFMLQQGVVPYSSDHSTPQFGEDANTGGDNSNPGLTALNFYTSFANPDNKNYTWNSNSDYSIDSFANGRAAFLYSYSYTWQTIVQKSPNLNFDVAPVPQPSLDAPSVNFANYWGEVVSKQSKNQYVAWDFLKFLTSKTELDKYYAQVKVPSSRKDLIALQIQDPQIGVFANANLTAKAFYRPSQEQIDTIMGNMIDNVVLNGYSTSQALQQAQQQAATILQQQQ